MNVPSATPIFRVFISSTFGDLQAERDILQQRAFPSLRRFCEQNSARFQPVDLRWGISEEAGVDHRTMNICLEELERCRNTTPRPNFLVLLGERYGWRPLPPQVPADDFEVMLERLRASAGTGDLDRVRRWYRRDENAVPPEYVLQPRRGTDHRAWTHEETILRRLLRQAAASGHANLERYFDSATHQEIRRGALRMPDAPDHVVCYFRNFAELPDPADAGGRGFVDLNADGTFDREAHDRLTALKDELRRTLGPAGRVREYTAATCREDPEARLAQFCQDVENDLRSIIRERLAEASAGSPESAEDRLHGEFGAARCAGFVGRDGALRRIRSYVDGREDRPLLICGPGGSGKTALMAEAARSLEPAGSGADPRPVRIIRFIGSTPASADLRSLMQDLCGRIARAYGGAPDGIPADTRELIRELETRLADASPERPLIVMLDALDQLNPTDDAHQLAWLPTRLPPGAKLILSLLTPADGAATGPAATCYRAARARCPDASVLELAPMSRGEGARLLETWMRTAGRRFDGHDDRRDGRTLTAAQRRDILDKFSGHGLPLWLKLAFEDARHWTSYDDLPAGHDGRPGLAGSVPGILLDLFARLEDERHHGAVLTGRALGYLAAGRRGLTEDELLDVLSRETDGAVMEDFRRRSPTERAKPEAERLRRLPPLVWSRLLADLAGYLTHRSAHGASVLGFYHRQVEEAVRGRYLRDGERLRAHRELAGFFREQACFRSSREEQRARAGRRPPSPRPVNLRKVDELPHHVLEVARLAGGNDPHAPEWDAVADLLTDWEFLEAKAEAKP